MPPAALPVPGIRHQRGVPSTLSALVRQIVEAFGAMANPIPVQVGKKYLEWYGAGEGPKVLLVPEADGGTIGPMIEMGNAASYTHSCGLYVRAAPSGDDLGRFDAAYALMDVAISCVGVGGMGRITWAKVTDDSPTDVDDGFGVGLKTSFMFARDVINDPNRWRLPAATASTAGPRALTPDNKNGDGAGLTEFGAVVSAAVTTEPKE